MEAAAAADAEGESAVDRYDATGETDQQQGLPAASSSNGGSGGARPSEEQKLLASVQVGIIRASLLHGV